jgi:hypothetical protein
MDEYKKYFSGKYLTEKKESPYQLTFYTYEQFIERFSGGFKEEEQVIRKTTPRENYNPDFFCDYEFQELVFKLDPPSKITEFLDYHFEKYCGNKLDFIDHISIVMNSFQFHYQSHYSKPFVIPGEEIITLVSDDGKHTSYITKLRDQSKVLKRDRVHEWIEEKRKELKAEVKGTGTRVEKIKWKESPAVFTFLFRKLVEKGYIEPPKYGTEWSYSGFAKLCLEHFDIDVDLEYFTRAMRNPDALTNTKKGKFTIPDTSEIA